MKKILSMLLLVVVALFLLRSSLLWLADTEIPKNAIFDYVKENQELLENFPYDKYYETIKKSDAYGSISKKFIRDYLGDNAPDFHITEISATETDENRVMTFDCCRKFSLKISNTYTGFYYSEADAPYADDLTTELKETSPGVYEWGDGNITIRHEKITDHWYYYYEQWT